MRSQTGPVTRPSTGEAGAGAYGDFIQKLCTRCGADTTIVAVGARQYAGQVQQVVKARNDAGDSRVRYWFLDDSGLDFLGCDWHCSAHDDRVTADLLRLLSSGARRRRPLSPAPGGQERTGRGAVGRNGPKRSR
ncbi:hypothetical protein [Streptomyces albicerus]|uniref:hypothetical protein n=1 Tax=Streptomyces albicerus TaxID=2569859 RepID=UPI001CECAF2A|nr:hypothetical protein [Streptomyces albicerus]